MVNAPGRPSRACDICKKQKIRCTGERPSCKRCLRLKNQCQYDSNTVRVRERRNVSNFKPARDLSVSAPGLQRSLARAPLHDAFNTEPLSAEPDEAFYHGVPSFLVNPLVEEYFENIYQSDLLLHKDTFMQSLAERTVRPHVLLSICAWGANFYRDKTGRAIFKEDGLMTKWAKQAGALVFQEAEELHEDNIVTFCNLSLFWHSQGSWRISYLHKGNACQLLHIIGIGPQAPNNNSALEFEIRRRRFWACYLFHCFSSEKLFHFDAITNVYDLPLPWPEDSFAAEFSRSPVATIKNKSNGGIFADLIRGLTLWCSVVSVVRSTETDFNSRLQTIFRVENEISTWWSNVSDKFKVDASEVAIIAMVEPKELPKILLTNIVYQQSLCALHASIVPLFCWSKGDKIQSSARQLSAQVAFEHACQVYVRCLHDVHKRNPPKISNEPKYADISVFIDFEVDASLAKASILEFTGILRSDEHGFTKPGQESSDLRTVIVQHGRDATVETHKQHGVDVTSSIQASGDLSSESSNLPMDITRPDTELALSPDRFVSGASEWPTFDVFSSLFDADMTSLLPQDQNLDLSFLTTDPVSWDLFNAAGNQDI
ncbi:hypothetical protein FSARC_8825 [Fusarium sarcochroum]|uniref:Zn(2)-C6 fungal-type domain-containing protein n=1 Tax=Fusarium sarcochroum TaxID=1208366 RepID=A0A8H4TS96_9HYPO|nr:hypothetical protein FSARC_8825 [Fusarium sarcochroum]